MDLDTVARELYGRPLADFVTARSDLAKEARSSGDRALAKQVQGLRKPTAAAWLVNQLSREHEDEVSLLLDLGRELRAGISGLEAEDLRVLTRRRYQFVSALVQQARALGRQHGQRVSDDVANGVRTTLEATLADPASADAVAAGCLTTALQSSGFGVEEPVHSPRPQAPLDDADAEVLDLDEHRQRRADAVRRAEAAFADAEAAAQQAHARRDEAATSLSEAERARDEAADVVRRLEEEITAARAGLEGQNEQVQERSRGRDVAEQQAREADRELADAREQLRELNR